MGCGGLDGEGGDGVDIAEGIGVMVGADELGVERFDARCMEPVVVGEEDVHGGRVGGAW